MSNKYRTAAEIQASILAKRGITPDQQQGFLSPDFYEHQHDASTMKGMAVAVARLTKALKEKEIVLVFGDYDADGVPATALLYRAWARLGGTLLPRIPTRAEGYGLSQKAVDDILAAAPSLLITVDNGTVAQAEIAQLAAAGIDTIVIDHHEPQAGEVADAALAIINPKQADCPYPFKEMCGCGLAWKVMREVYRAMDADPEQLKWELDLVALSTVADMVPLIGENRVLVQYGLKVLRKTRNLGLRALLENAGLTPETVRAGDLGYRIAPRINAPSRMHNEQWKGGNAALQLLITDNPAEAHELAAFLGEMNGERQQLVTEHLRAAEEQAELQAEALCLTVYGADWSTGVIGLVASKLMEKYRRPVIALAPEGDEVKGSVRTLEPVHALEMLTAARDLLPRFGGHARAAGLSLQAAPEVLHERVNTWLAGQGIEVAQLEEGARKVAEAEVAAAEASLELAQALQDLEPFGVGFPAPVLESRGRFEKLRLVGSEKQHVSGFFADTSAQRKMIAFGRAYLNPEIGKEYIVRYNLKSETWNGIESPVLVIQSFQEVSSEHS